MYTGRIEIPFEGRTLEDATDFAINLLSCLYKNGQVIHWSLAATSTTLDAFVNIPDGSALDPSSHGEYVVATLEADRAKGNPAPRLFSIHTISVSCRPCAA